MKKEKLSREYEPPRVVTYSADDLIEFVGPAQSCSFGGTSIRREH